MQVQSTSLSSHFPLNPYTTFYKEVTVSKILKVFKELNLSYTVSSDYSKIVATDVSDESKYKAIQSICNHDYFLALPRVDSFDSKNELHFSISLNLNDKNHFLADLVQIANTHPDPVKFLLDHKHYWNFRAGEAVSVLAELENVEKPGVMSTFAEILEGKKADYDTRSEAIEGLGRALTIPNLKDKAKSLLLKVAVFDQYEYTSYFELRIKAWKQLKNIIQEPDVRAVFEKIAQEDKRIPLRFEALNYLDQIETYHTDFEIEIVKSIISSLDVHHLNKNEGMLLDYILWSSRSYSYQAIQALGEQKIVESLIKQFIQSGRPYIVLGQFFGLTPVGGWSATVSETAHFYTILKFIGLNTKDQTLFNKIVDALIKVCLNKDLGLLEPLEDVLNQFKNNSAVEMPNLENIKIKRHSKKERPESAFGNLSREKDGDNYSAKRVSAILELIKCDKLAVPVRKVAIRECSKYLFTDKEYPWVQTEYSGYAKNIVSVLQELNLSELTDKEIKTTANSLLTIYKQNDGFL